MLIIGIVVALFVIPCNCINSCSIRLIWNLSLTQSNFLALLQFVWQRHANTPSPPTHITCLNTCWVWTPRPLLWQQQGLYPNFIYWFKNLFSIRLFHKLMPPTHTGCFFWANLHTSLHAILLFFINNLVLCLYVCVCVSSTLYSSTNNGVSWPMFCVVAVVVACYICIANACFKCICHIVVVPIAIIERVKAFLY